MHGNLETLIGKTADKNGTPRIYYVVCGESESTPPAVVSDQQICTITAVRTNANNVSLHSVQTNGYFDTYKYLLMKKGQQH